MFGKITKYFLPSLIGLSALSVSVSAAFYSVSGLSKLFAGASFEVMVMAGSLEASKLVLATLLHQYWNVLNKWLKLYLTSAVVILIVITSMGIYGFLSAAYQETANKASIVDTRISFLEQKRDFFLEDVSRYDNELERISSNINTLSQARSREIQVRDTSSSTGFRNTISTTELRLAQDRITAEELNRKEIEVKRSIAADSLQRYEVLILEANIGNDLAAELGPLKYLSGLTGWSMDKIVNVLLLIIIFVFDPLAVSMVVAANFAFDHVSKKNNNKKEIEDEEMIIIPDEEDDKSEEEFWENTLEDGLDDIPYEEDNVKPDLTDKEAKVFSEEYTGEKEPQETRIEKIVQQTPSHVHVVLKDGSRKKVTRKQVDFNENKIRYF